MFVLRQYTGFVLLVFVPLTGLFAVCMIGCLLAMAGKKLTRVVVALALRRGDRTVKLTTGTNANHIQPRVVVAARVEA
jgi:hypothetical protein